MPEEYEFSYDPSGNRLTMLANDALQALKDSERYQPGDKIIIMVQDAAMGGIAAHGYEDPASEEPMMDLLRHIRAMFRAQGNDLILIPFAQEPN